jgi:hypothetical protein
MARGPGGHAREAGIVDRKPDRGPHRRARRRRVDARPPDKLGFDVERRTAAAAGAAGITGGYRELIEATGSGDTAVVYYSGHRGRVRNPLAGPPGIPQWLQYIVPTDIEDSSDGQAHCVLAEELSLLQLQLQLTQRTRNATVILDCCHAARMSRRGDDMPKAIDTLVVGHDLVERWRMLRAHALEADANPDAVQVTACGADQSAYESWNPTLGKWWNISTRSHRR